MNRHIIIPAGGKAVRFNGMLKDMLPIDDIGTTALEGTLDRAFSLYDTRQVILITNTAKWYLHDEFTRMYIKKHNLPKNAINLLMKGNNVNTLWDAILQGLHSIPNGVPGGLMLPDTITRFNVDHALTNTINAGITFGLFDTYEPERFSVVEDNQIYTKVRKCYTIACDTPYKAWGVVLWSAHAHLVMMQHYWRETEYDVVFSKIMADLGYNTFDLDYYYDIGTLEAYINYKADKDMGVI